MCLFKASIKPCGPVRDTSVAGKFLCVPQDLLGQVETQRLCLSDFSFGRPVEQGFSLRVLGFHLMVL